MANMSFPTSPTVGQQYLFGVRLWQWNGTVWQRKA